MPSFWCISKDDSNMATVFFLLYNISLSSAHIGERKINNEAAIFNLYKWLMLGSKPVVTSVYDNFVTSIEEKFYNRHPFCTRWRIIRTFILSKYIAILI